MARVVDNNKINPNPCGPEDNAANWATQSVINNNQTIINQNGGGADTYKVGVNATDVANATFDFLHAKIHDNATYVSGQDMVVASATVGNVTERFFVDVSAITNFSGSGSYFLIIAGGVTAWAPLSAAIDNYTVLVTGSDTTPSYLHDAIKDNAAYVSGADILVASATDGANGTDQKERFFVDVSAIGGYSDTGTYAFLLINNVTTLVDVTSGGLADTYKVKSTANDTTAAYLHDAVNTNATRVSTEDAIVACETAGASSTNQKEEFFLDSSVINSYSSIPDGETWQLSLSRSGSTRTLKWAHSSAPGSLGRVKTASPFSAATGDSAAAAGTGTLNFVANDGTLDGPHDALSTYADEIQEGIPGWAFTDSDGNLWLVNAGCNQLIT